MKLSTMMMKQSQVTQQAADEANHDSRRGYQVDPPSPKIVIASLKLSLDTPFPLDVDFKTQIGQFLSNNIFKSIENPALHDKVFSVVRDERICKICLSVMQIVLMTKYPHTVSNAQVLVAMKLKLSKTYVKFFSSLPQPKDEIINYIIFMCGYNIHWMLWRIVKDSREEMDLRFVFDCYHILIFSLNGIYVSDSYIRVQIEKVFSSRFMEYEREKKEKLIMQKIEKKKKNNERTFLGNKIDYPDVSKCTGGSEFSKILNDKLRLKSNKLLSGVEDAQPQDLTKYNLHSTISAPDNLNTHPKEEFNMNKQEVKLLLQNLQLNVNQISPTIFHVLQMNQMQLPFSRKKMLSHTFEKVDDKTQGILNLLKEMTNQRKMKKDSKQAKKYQQSLIEIYDLRAPVKEYFQKHTKVDPMFKDMLELNYVLTYQQESLNSLYSTKELHKNLNEEVVDESTTNDAAKLLLSPQRRLMAYLLTKQQLTATTTSTKESIMRESYLINNNDKKQQQYTLFPTLIEKTLSTEADTIKQSAQVKRSKVVSLMKIEDSAATTPLRQKPTHIQFKEPEDQIYTDKKKYYKNKYDQILNSESTDSKIDSIVQNLQVKQNLISKSLSKRIHKL